MASNATVPNQLPALLNLPAPHRASLAPYLPPTLSSQPSSLPHLTLTYATSLDSAIALAPGTQTALSGPATKAMTHYLRSQHAAILVGTNTAIVDDPALTCRHISVAADSHMTQHSRQPEGEQAGAGQQPVPVILDPSARWQARSESQVLSRAREGRGRGVLWVVGAPVDGERQGRVRGCGGEVLVLGEGVRNPDGGVEWGVVLEALAGRGIRSVMVEGGARVIMDLLRERNRRFVSSVVVTVAPVWLGEGAVAVCPPRGEGAGEVGRLRDVLWVPMGEDVVVAGRFGDRGR